MNVTQDIYERLSELQRGALATFCELVTVTNRDKSTYRVADTASHILNTWDGGNGNSDIFLPPVADNDGRLIAFHSDSTISANTYVKLQPDTNDTGVTIDGASSYDFNRAYDGITILSNGSNWFIIQKKEK